MPAVEATQSAGDRALPLDAVIAGAIEALGAVDLSPRTEEIERHRFAPGQGYAPDGPPMQTGTTRLRVAWAPETRDLTLDVVHRPTYPYPFPGAFTFREALRAGTHGEIDGADAFEGESSRPMPAARAAMREKMRLVSHPLAILQAARGGEAVEGDPWHIAFEVRGASMQAHISPETRRLQRLNYLEDHPLLGDVAMGVHYQDWRETPTGGVEPHALVFTADDHVVQVDRIVSRAPTAPDPGTPPTLAAPDEARLGWLRAWFQLHWIGYGFPMDRAGRVDEVEWTPIAPGVFVIGYGFHNSMVVELDPKRAVLVEAPFSDAAVEAGLAAIAAHLPGREVVGVVQTHWHHDHIGGLRAVVGRGLPIYATPAGATRARRIAARPRTLMPDALAAAPRAPEIREDMVIVGAREVRLVEVSNHHVGEMLAAYVPAERVLFNADLFNPGLVPTRGLVGWFVRGLIGSSVPYVLVKAGTFAADLQPVVEELGVRYIVGGHGPDVATPEDLATLVEYADPEGYARAVEEGAQLD